MDKLDCIAVYDTYSFEDMSDNNKAQLLAIAKTNYDLIREALDPTDAELVLKYATTDLTTSDLADIYGLSQSSVSRRINKAKETLRLYLKWCNKAIRYYIDKVEND